MNLTTAARGFVAFLLSLPALQGNDDWTVTCTSSNVCSVRGSTVNISCTFKYPEKQHDLSTTVLETLWFTKEDRNQKPVDLLSDADYTGRVESSCGEISCIGSSCNRKCTLSIRDLRQSDSDVYNFRFKTNQPGGEHTANPGVALTVTGLRVEVTPVATVTEGQRVTLTCITSCPLADKPFYIWYQNNGPVTGSENPENQLVLDPVIPQHAGIYSCSFRNYPHLRSPEETLTVQYAPQTPSVSVSPSGEVVEGSSVTLSCSSDANPAANYTWFKEHEDSVGESGQNYTITNITSELGGHYYCQAHNAIGRHNSTSLFIIVTDKSSSLTTVAVGTVAVLLVTMVIFLLIFLCMRRKRASRKACGQRGRPDTGEQVRDRKPFLTNLSFTKTHTQRELIEEQDDIHYASIHISHSGNQEVPHRSAGSPVQSRQTEEVLYSLAKFIRPNTVPE
ncbi:unnamed protein product [Merluccius merluccius]